MRQAGRLRPSFTRAAAIRAALAGAALVIALVTVAGCGTPSPPSEPAGIVGRVERIDAADGQRSMLVVGGKQAPGAVSDRASCRITDETTVVDASGNEVGAEQLAVGDQVSVWFTGPVAESYPVQGTASFVQIR